MRHVGQLCFADITSTIVLSQYRVIYCIVIILYIVFSCILFPALFYRTGTVQNENVAVDLWH